MRTILFRGKDKEGEWHYGRLAYMFVDIEMAEASVDVIQDENHNTWQINPDTICEYTGLMDSNGKRIFEGDIVHVYGYGNVICAFGGGQWGGFEEGAGVVPFCPSIWGMGGEVVGNRWDNPELLFKEEQK